MKLQEAKGACRCFATGPGVQPKGVRVNDDAYFNVHTQFPVNGGFGVGIIDPYGTKINAWISQINSVAYRCAYKPITTGLHKVIVKYKDQPIAKSPFEVFVESAICEMACGPGLETGVVGCFTSFTVVTNGKKGIAFRFDGMEKPLTYRHDYEDGSYNVWYRPPITGQYLLHILYCDGEHLPNSPYIVNIGRMSYAFDPTKVEVSGLGLEEIGNKSAEFKVDTRKAGNALLIIDIFDVDYNRVQAHKKCDNDGIYKCRYKPTKSVKHMIFISFGGISVNRSPFRVLIKDAVDPSKVKIYGPGIDHPVKIFQPNYLIVDCTEAGPGGVLTSLTDKFGFRYSVKTTDNGDKTFRIDFEPIKAILYFASIVFACQELPGSPYAIRAKLTIDVSNVKVVGPIPKAQEACRCFATGPGVQPKGVYAGDIAVFNWHTQVPVNGGFSVKIFNQYGSQVKARITQITSVSYSCIYRPFIDGLYTVFVQYRDQQIAGSPFKVEVENERHIKAFGPGLNTGVAGFPASFTVDANGKLPYFSVLVDGLDPSALNRYEDSADFFYTPPSAGTHLIHILNAIGTDISNSPYTAIIRPVSDAFAPTKVEVSGRGLRKLGNIVNKWTEFKVDTRKAGNALLKIDIFDDVHSSVQTITNYQDGICKCLYFPRKSVKHNVLVSFGDVAIPDSPYRIFIQDAGKVKVYGPAIDHPLKIFQPTYLIVDCTKAGPGDVFSTVMDKEGLEPSVTKSDNGDKTFRIDFEPTKEGLHVVTICFANHQLPGSPYKINATHNTDVSKVKVEGLKKRLPAGDVASFSIITKDAGEAQVQVQVSSPSGKFIYVNIEESDDGFGVKFTPFEIGFHFVEVIFDGQTVPQSPFRCKSYSKDENVFVSGLGLKSGEANTPATFEIVTNGKVEQASFDLFINGPRDPEIQCINMQDGIYTFRYLPTEPGEYLINISCDDKPIVNSPFKVFILPGQKTASVLSDSSSGNFSQYRS